MSKNSSLKNMLLLAVRELLHHKTYGKNYRTYGYGKPRRQRGARGWLMERALRELDRRLTKSRRW